MTRLQYSQREFGGNSQMKRTLEAFVIRFDKRRFCD